MDHLENWLLPVAQATERYEMPRWGTDPANNWATSSSFAQTIPAVNSIIASTSPYATGFFNMLLYVPLALLGFVVAGMAIIAIKRGMAGFASKIFGKK